MARTPSSTELNYTVPIKASRLRFKVSAAFANIDSEKISSKANVEVEVGTFAGDGCGRVVSAVVKMGKVVDLKVSPCAAVRPINVDTSLKSLVIAARKKLGEKSTPRKFRPMDFLVFQESADDITIKTITCVQVCIWGHCFVCCTTPDGGTMCGDTITIHVP